MLITYFRLAKFAKNITSKTLNKRKIINDPVYGFINIPNETIFDLIEHPFFQRLRRIKQLGLTHLVYPGALHTRFHHSLGAMHLMQQAISVLKAKGHQISSEEEQGVLIAILLHDIGHGPFSHALEYSLVKQTNHESISKIFMVKLNEEFDYQLTTGIDIFLHKYPKCFLSQLVSGQLDIDRLDYLKRDSFFTGVSEGVIGTERIIKMLDIVDDNLVVEEKGIYSLEKFIVARRIMYWQVYLHKAVLSAESMLIKALERAKHLARKGDDLFATEALSFFLYNDFSYKDFILKEEIINTFSKLDDFDIFSSIKAWTTHTDKILSYLCKSIVNRNLFRCEIQQEPFDYFYLEKLKNRIIEKFDIQEDEVPSFFIDETTSNFAYKTESENINIKAKSGKVCDILEASDHLDIPVLSNAVTKHFICYPKDVNN